MAKNNHKNNNRSNISPSTDELQKKIASSLTFHDNLGERILTTSESKIKLCLKDFIDNFESQRAWQVPLTVFLTILLTFLTADFKDWIFSKNFWEAGFAISAIISFCWLLIKFKNIRRRKTVEDIINELMPE